MAKKKKKRLIAGNRIHVPIFHIAYGSQDEQYETYSSKIRIYVLIAASDHEGLDTETECTPYPLCSSAGGGRICNKVDRTCTS